MKLILITSDFPPGKGGISTLSKNLALTLRRVPEQFEVHVLYSKNKVEKNDSDFEFPVYRSGTKSFLGNFLYVLKIFYKNKFSKTIYQTPNLFPAGFFVVISRLIFGGFSVVHSHGTDFLSKLARPLVKRFKKITLRLADKVIFISESTKREVLKEVNLQAKKTDVVYCPIFQTDIISEISRQEIREEFGLSSNDFVLLSVGNLVYRKGNHLIIEAIKNLPENIKLFLVGDGPERPKLQKMVEEHGLTTRVFLEGRVPETKKYYTLADLFIMASFYDKKEGDIEGLGIVILEAELMGLPTIVARSGGMPEAISEGETGLVFAENSFSDLAEKILNIYQDANLREKFKKNGSEFIEREFSSKKIAGQYLKIYKELREKNDGN